MTLSMSKMQSDSSVSEASYEIIVEKKQTIFPAEM